MVQEARTFDTQFTRTVRLNCLLHLPKDYGTDPGRDWPLILFLQGMGERGDDLELIKLHGIPKVLEQRDDLPFIVVSPQCARDSVWTADTEALNALLDEVVARFAVDPDRIYLTGLSMGGFGTWHLAQQYPDRFAALAPVCGGGNPYLVTRLKNIPIRAFHGAQDRKVPIGLARQMVETLRLLGGRVEFKVYPKLGHNVWTVTYSNPRLYEWFLQYRRNGEAIRPRTKPAPRSRPS